MNRTTTFACRFACAILFAIALLSASAHPLYADKEGEAVERFLTRLGLGELQTLHLEKQLQGESDGGERLKIARRLADLYAGQLMDAADDPAAYQQILTSIRSLTEKYPQANTTALKVMLLQADYNRAEALVGEWMTDSSKADAKAQAREILAQIAPQLNEHRQELNQQVEKLLSEIDELEEGDLRAEKEEELIRRQAVAGRATYFAGWSNYYLGLTGGAESKGNFATARQIFRQLLDIPDDDKDYTKVEVEWLGLESIWRARTVIGLGLSEAAAGNVASSANVFRWLEGAGVAPQIRDQAAYWYVQGLLNAGQLPAALEYAQQRIDRFGGEATQGKISLCVALVRAGFSPPGNDSPEAKKLGMLGVTGMAKLRQMSALKKLIAQYEIDLSQEGGFFLTWLRGQELFAKAEKSKKEADYQAAAEVFQEALATPESKTEVSSAAQCRYHLAWCHYRMTDFQSAAREFEQAVTGLKGIEGDAAVQSAWMAYAAYRQLTKDNPAAVGSAVNVLQRIKRDFPGSKFSKRADYHIAKLQSTSDSPQESIAALQKIKPGESNYLAARYDLCLLLFGQWAKAKGTAQAAAAAQNVVQAADVFLQAAGNDELSRKATCGLKVVEIALAQSPPNQTLAQSYMAKVKPLAAELPASDSAAAEFHYRALQLARITGDVSARQQHAQWLLENAPGSAYELSALITTATAVDKDIQEAGENTAALEQEAYRVYARLADVLGASPEAIASEKNARVAVSKMAHFAFETGRFAEAAQAMERLLAAFPKNKDYLRRAGLAQYQAGRFEPALGHWETLLRGLPAGEDGWYEAKYYQLACLAKTNQEAARKVLKQFKLLYPELGGNKWRARFQGLEQTLSK